MPHQALQQITALQMNFYMLSFSFVSMHIFISSVIYWFFRSVLFNFHMFVFLIVFFPVVDIYFLCGLPLWLSW